MSEGPEIPPPEWYTAGDWAVRREERHREAARNDRLARESRARIRRLRRRIYRMREFPEAWSDSYRHAACVSLERLERAVFTLEGLADQYSARAEYLREDVCPL